MQGHEHSQNGLTVEPTQSPKLNPTEHQLTYLGCTTEADKPPHNCILPNLTTQRISLLKMSSFHKNGLSLQ